MKQASTIGKARVTMAARIRSRAVHFMGAALAVATLTLANPGCAQTAEGGDDQANEATVSKLREVVSSIRSTEDGTYMSSIGPVDEVDSATPASLAHEQKQPGPGRPQPMLRCWTDQGVFTCCHGTTCCVLVEGTVYCG